MPSFFDYGDECKEHLSYMLDEAFARWGLSAVIDHALSFDNDFKEIREPEPIYKDELDPTAPGFWTPVIETLPYDPRVKTTVLLGQPIEGLMLDSEFISYADKVTTQYKITCKDLLLLEDRITVTFNDGKILRLRVIEPPKSLNSLSSVFFSSLTQVTD